MSAVKEIDLYSLYMQELHGLPADWEWHSASSRDEDVPEGFMRFVGAVAPMFKTKPRRNWNKMDRSTQRTFFISRSEFNAWAEARGERLNECVECRGKGDVFTGWSVQDGERHKTCPRCNGTGDYQPKRGAE